MNLQHHDMEQKRMQVARHDPLCNARDPLIGRSPIPLAGDLVIRSDRMGQVKTVNVGAPDD